jgi:hypothetical protein
MDPKVMALAMALAGQQPADTPKTAPKAEVPNPITRLTQKEAYRQAIDEGKPLAIWVNYKCPSTALQLTDFVHTFASDYKGDSTPRVVVGLPDGQGWLSKAGEVSGEDCCASNVRLAAERGPTNHARGWAVTGQASPPPPAWGPSMQSAPPPPRRMFLAPARPTGGYRGGRGGHGACVG